MENRISLKKLKVFGAGSEETLCFQTDICLDGKVVGHVGNNGHGGCHNTYWTDKKAGAEIEAWADKQILSYENFEGETEEVQHEKLDWIISEMIEAEQEKKTIARWCKKNTVFKFKGAKKGEWQTVKTPFSPAVRAAMIKKYGDKIELFANEGL